MTRDDLGEGRVYVARGEVSAQDRGLLYGDGVFESFRLYDGKPAFVDRHLERLDDALAAVELDVSVAEGDVDDAVERLDVDGDAYLRVTVTRGSRTGLLEPTGEEQPLVVWTAAPLGRRRYPPASVETTSVERPPGAEGRHKTLNYLSNVLARLEVDADEALMVDSAGNPVSGSVSNLYAVHDDVVETADERVRPGVTREIVLDVAADLDLDVRAKPPSLDDADAVFLTNTTWGVRAVRELDGASYDVPDVVDELSERYLERALDSAREG
ncbi:MAG: aminotransferase class IV [Halobacteriota archaeon]